MKLILPYFILILFLLQHNMKKNSKKEKINNETFWKRESEANSVRKKDISGLDYIRIPDTLTCPDTQDERILKEWHTIEALKEKLPPKTNLANLLMDTLYIGREAIYRRLRGEVPFTLEEAALISRKLGVSLDKLYHTEPLPCKNC